MKLFRKRFSQEKTGRLSPWIAAFLAITLFSGALTGCQSQVVSASPPEESPVPLEPVSVNSESGTPDATAFPTRPPYQPGELVDYTAQTGDTLPALALRFNTSVKEILAANTFIPASATTLPPGMPMRIPIYYLPFWGTPYHILPDSLFVNGPAQIGFDTEAFVREHSGWLASYSSYASGEQRSGAQLIDLIAKNYSVSPRMLLALVEYQAGGLSQPELPADKSAYPLGLIDRKHSGFYMQLGLAANILNNGYYGWRKGDLTTLELLNGRLERPDPWQNAATVAFQYFFSRLLDQDAYNRAISPDGFAKVYQDLFGDPWQSDQPHIPGSLEQPALRLPFQPGKVWAFTGGPHTGWGDGEPLSAIDFAPPTVVGGCTETNEWATAAADGVIVRSEPATVVIDLDGDGDEHTGWVIYYLHVATKDRIPQGTVVKAGDPIGHPSCEGGQATGTHVHIARKYNGEWILADGALPFNLEGWIVHNGPEEYQGTMTRFGHTITACVCSDYRSQISSQGEP